MRIGLLTGPVGAGKTTVAERVVGLARRRGLACGGLLAPAMTDQCGQKVGIWGADVRSGERRILARTDRELGGPTIGPYSFDVAALDWAIDLLEGAFGCPPAPVRPCDLVVVDEIGKLELWCGSGLAPILPRLASGQVPWALVLVRDSLLDELRARLGSLRQVVFQVSEANREEMPFCILEQLIVPYQSNSCTKSKDFRPEAVCYEQAGG